MQDLHSSCLPDSVLELIFLHVPDAQRCLCQTGRNFHHCCSPTVMRVPTSRATLLLAWACTFTSSTRLSSFIILVLNRRLPAGDDRDLKALMAVGELSAPELPAALAQLTGLRDLHLTGCTPLLLGASCLGRLSSVTSLSVYGTGHALRGLALMPSLRRLSLSSAPSLRQHVSSPDVDPLVSCFVVGMLVCVGRAPASGRQSRPASLGLCSGWAAGVG